MKQFSEQFSNLRVILYHKQSTSAMTRFFRFDDGGVLIGGEVAKLAEVVTAQADSSVVPHPAAVISELCSWLGLEDGALSYDSGFDMCVEQPGEQLRIYLLRFTTIDPPFEAAESAGARFINLTQARDLSGVELELLRTAYAEIMEG